MHPVHLVLGQDVVEPVEADPDNPQNADHTDDQDEPPAQPGHEDDGDARGHQEQRRAQVRLFEDQQRGQADQQYWRDQARQAGDLLIGQIVIETRQGQHDGQFHDLGRLDPDRSDIDPALGAIDGHAPHLDQDQQYQRDDIGRIGHAHPEARRQHRDDHHRHHAHGQTDRVVQGPGRPAAATDRIEHGDPGHAEQHQEQDQGPVQLHQLAAQVARHALAENGH